MSHIASHIIIDSAAAVDDSQHVRAVKIELTFAAGTPIQQRVKKYAQAERMIERLQHDDTQDSDHDQ